MSFLPEHFRFQSIGQMSGRRSGAIALIFTDERGTHILLFYVSTSARSDRCSR
jgi:hypothetical protein